MYNSSITLKNLSRTTSGIGICNGFSHLEFNRNKEEGVLVAIQECDWLSFFTLGFNFFSRVRIFLMNFLMIAFLLLFILTFLPGDNFINTWIVRGVRHCTEVAFALHAQQVRVRLSAFPRFFTISWRRRDLSTAMHCLEQVDSALKA